VFLLNFQGLQAVKLGQAVIGKDDLGVKIIQGADESFF
jgi:hypothetical protein